MLGEKKREGKKRKMVKEVEGIVLNFAPGEERNIWFMVIGCIVGFLPFEALTIYQLMYGTDDDGGGGGGNGRENGGGKYIARGSRSDETGSRYMRADSGQSTASNVIAVPGDLEADEPSPPTPSSMATLEHPGPQKDKGDDDISAAYTIGHLPRQMPAVEGLRIIGAVHIVAFHFYLFEHKETQCLPCRLGEWWVHIFFVITGLVSYRSASRQKTTADAHAFGGLRLLERRLKHIYPITFISFVIMYFVRMYNDAYVTSVSVLRVLMLSSSWTPPFHDSSVLNGPAWYISNLVPFWLLLPHWARALRRASRKCLFLMLAVLYVGSFAPFVTRYMVIQVPGTVEHTCTLISPRDFDSYVRVCVSDYPMRVDMNCTMIIRTCMCANESMYNVLHERVCLALLRVCVCVGIGIAQGVRMRAIFWQPCAISRRMRISTMYPWVSYLQQCLIGSMSTATTARAQAQGCVASSSASAQPSVLAAWLRFSRPIAPIRCQCSIKVHYRIRSCTFFSPARHSSTIFRRVSSLAFATSANFRSRCTSSTFRFSALSWTSSVVSRARTSTSTCTTRSFSLAASQSDPSWVLSFRIDGPDTAPQVGNAEICSSESKRRRRFVVGDIEAAVLLRRERGREEKKGEGGRVCSKELGEET